MSTCFEEHDVITRFGILVRSIFAYLYTVSHCVVINLLEIVGAENNTCRIPKRLIIEMLSVTFSKVVPKTKQKIN